VRLTPALLATWQDCPRRYWHTYIARTRPAGGPWAHLAVGAAAHAGLAAWVTASDPQRARLDALAAVRALWDPRPFRDPEQSARWLDRVTGWTAAYMDAPPNAPGAFADAPPDASDAPPDALPNALPNALGASGWRPDAVGVERTVAARLPGTTHTVEARTDRIDIRRVADGGTVLVPVDYKAGRTPPTGDDAAGSLQLAIQGLAASRTLSGRCVSAELHHIPTRTVAAAEFTPIRARHHLDLIAALATDIERAARFVADNDPGGKLGADDREDLLGERDAYPVRVAGLCPSCPFLDACGPAQAAAQTRAQPWAYLAEGGSA
jgi:putative RecB family exonuclease